MRKSFLIGSASMLAIATPAAAQQTTPPPSVADAETSDDVIVTGVRASLEKAIELKRQADNHVEVISAADIGKLPDKNVADALQRLPGLNTSSAASGEGGFDENDRVSIRGTSPSLTQVTIDGHQVSTGDWFILDQFSTVGRSTSFDLLPSEIVSAVVVNKTQDASLLEGGVAGSIDLRLRSALDLNRQLVLEGSAQGAYNTQSAQTKPQLNALVGWRNRDATFGILVQGFYEQRSLRRYGQEILGYSAIAAPTFDAQGKVATSVTGAAIPSLIGVQAPTLIGSAYFSQTRTRKGGVTTINWKPSATLELKASGFYSYLNASNVNDNYLAWGSREIDRNAPTSYTVKNNTLVAASFPLVSTTPNTEYTGQQIEGIVEDNAVRPDASGQTWFANLDATWHPTERLTVNAQGGYTSGRGLTPQQPFFEVDAPTGVAFAPSGNGFAVTTSNLNPASPNGLSNDFAINAVFRSLDHEGYGKLDASLDLDGVLSKIDFGARIADHERKVVAWDRGCTLGANGDCFGAGLFPFANVNPTPYPSGFNADTLGIPGLAVPLAGNPTAITNVINAIQNPLRGNLAHTIQPANEYWLGEFKVKERDIEGYALAHFKGDGFRGNLGVRVVSTREDAFVNTPGSCQVGSSSGNSTCIANVTTSAFGNFYIDEVRHTYTDVLPSANVTIDLQPKLLLRLAAAETLSRADYSALGGTVSLTDTNFTGSGGNPNLKPIKATVIDGSLEYYYGPASLIALSVFHDGLQSYVTFGTSVGTYFTQLDNKFHDYTISSPSNTTGELTGIELQVQQPIAYGFGFQANGTYIDGRETSGQPLVGTSKWTYNLVGYYEKGPLSLRLAYTYRSHYFVGLDRSSAENQDNYGQLDGSLNVSVTKNIALTADALNITNAKLKYYALNHDQPRAVYSNGTQVFFGVRAKF